jgi:hypothetical protein
MNCNEFLSVIDEYIEDSLALETSNQIAKHIAGCGKCSSVFEELNNEREIYSRYLLKIKENPNSWNAVRREMRKQTGVTVATADTLGRGLSHRPLFVTMATAVLIVCVSVGLWYRSQVKKELGTTASQGRSTNEKENDRNNSAPPDQPKPSVAKEINRPPKILKKHSGRQPDAVVFDSSEAAFNRHFEKCEMVLRSFRNAVPLANETAGFDISDERRFAKQLLKDSARFRREAQIKGDLPLENLLVDVETILGKISALPKKATSSDAFEIKGRIQQSGIIGKLQIQSLLARSAD